MILAEITDNEKRIELFKLEGADPELLAELCQDGWVLIFHDYIVLALLSHVIAPRLAYELFISDMTKGIDIADFFVTVTGLWYHHSLDVLYAVGEVGVVGIPTDLIASCTVNPNMECKSWGRPSMSPGIDDIDLYPACSRLGKNKKLDYLVPREKMLHG